MSVHSHCEDEYIDLRCEGGVINLTYIDNTNIMESNDLYCQLSCYFFIKINTNKMIGSNTEDLLKQLVKNTSSKLSNSIVLSGNTSNFTIGFSPTISLSQDRNYEVALIRLETYYSFPNINETNNLFKYSPNFGTTWNTIAIPTGCYEISAINAYIQRAMKDAGYYDSTNSAYYITISTNFNTFKAIISLAPNYKIDFTIKIL